jgi:hypothetical protein
LEDQIFNVSSLFSFLSPRQLAVNSDAGCGLPKTHKNYFVDVFTLSAEFHSSHPPSFSRFSRL